MDTLLNAVATTVRRWMLIPAKIIDRLSGSKVTPNHITLVSFLGHFLVLWALWQDRPIVAAVLLAFFGLMDSLDGALARIQKRQSTRGMFFDAVSDRAKEVLLFIGLSRFLISEFYDGNGALHEAIASWSAENNVGLVYWLPVAVLGCSLLVSYTKAKGEMAIALKTDTKKQDLNRIFADGIARYEVRMTIIIIGLITSNLQPALVLLLGLLIITVCQRFVRIAKVLR